MTDRTTDLGKLTVTEIAPQQTGCRPSIEHVETVDCELLVDYLELHFEIEYSRKGISPHRDGEVENLVATLTKAEAWCDKWGTTVKLERRFRENVERRFNERIKSGALRDMLDEQCLNHWITELERGW